MKNPREDAARTRKNLLEAAAEIFSLKGFRDATISEICGRAGTNIAAINYHFGSKEALYVEAWRRAFHESVEAHPPDGGVGDDAPPEDRLKAHISATLQRLADKNNREFGFVQREFANPTGLLEEVMKEEILPLRQRTENLVRELLGANASDRDIQFCEISIISQCINPMVAGRHAGDKDIGKGGPPKIDDIEAYADHVLKFSLAGLREMRKAVQVTAAKDVRSNKPKR